MGDLSSGRDYQRAESEGGAVFPGVFAAVHRSKNADTRIGVPAVGRGLHVQWNALVSFSGMVRRERESEGKKQSSRPSRAETRNRRAIHWAWNEAGGGSIDSVREQNCLPSPPPWSGVVIG